MIGTVNWRETDHVEASGQAESLVIRHHDDCRAAESYMIAYGDMAFDVGEDAAIEGGLYETAEGIFTQVCHAPLSPLSGPLLWYLTDVPGPFAEQKKPWAFVLDQDGRALNPLHFGI